VLKLLKRRLLYVYRAKFKYGEYVGLSRVRGRDLNEILPHLSLPMPNDWDHEDKRRLTLSECQTKFADRLSRHFGRYPVVWPAAGFSDSQLS